VKILEKNINQKEKQEKNMFLPSHPQKSISLILNKNTKNINTVYVSNKSEPISVYINDFLFYIYLQS
jgi:hypothetical protein